MTMKFRIFPVILLICTILCSCDRKDVSSTTTVVEQTNINSYDDSEEELFEASEFYTENQALFFLLIKENPIDTAYRFETDSNTTTNMAEREMNYANIWLEEWRFSCESFSALLNETDKVRFDDIQKNWKKNTLEDFNFINGIFNNENYGTHMGSDFSVECASEYRKSIRKQTLYVKYLLFCLESNKDTDIDPVVEFNYK